jgi:hypothetical protein
MVRGWKKKKPKGFGIFLIEGQTEAGRSVFRDVKRRSLGMDNT